MSRNITVAAILMLLTGVQAQHSVTLSSQSLCVVTGSTVKIPCRFTKPYYSTVTEREWYRVQSSEGEPRDLNNDPEYSGRVSVSTWWSDCELTVRNVRVSDSGVYNFRFKTQSSDWISASSGVQLTVTGVLGKKCWGVTYTPEHVCALKNTSIDLSCSYKYPAGLTVTKSVWFIKKHVNVKHEDVRKDEEYQGRVQYTQSSQNDCSLRITNLRERDAQTYRFRFYTNDPAGKYTGEPGVTLSVTDLKVTVSDSGSGQIKLNCITTCTLSNNPTYIWYKNGRRVSECKSASCSVAAVGGVVSYSCAVEGHDSLLSPPVYSPTNTRAVVLPSGDTVEGDSVTLSCSSDANPPVLTYSWFKQSAAADTLLTTGQNYSISNISSQDSGLYYCTAHHQLGNHTSTPTHLDVLYPPKNTSAVVLPSGDTVEGDSVTLSCSSDANPPVLTYSWFKQSAAADTLLTTGQNYSISYISSQDSGLYYCTAHHQLGNHTSTPTHLDVLGSEKHTMLKPIIEGLLVFLALTLIPGTLWMWKRKRSSANGHSSTGESGQSAAAFANIPTSYHRGRVASDDQDDIHYTSVVFKRFPTHERFLSPRHPPHTREEEEVQYAAVNISRSTAAIQLVADEAADDPSQIYSKIQ
ncbi:B-cell receptor CD22-like [Hemibagrus wyckioides]|uniref:B-cell receptor CD22-like n=1 Tax=Hemibagrus wyckioides TaxID=337641 RepID=UPI00266CA05F|nr:B-cell receptor CD22-like [Hemibagrus wyckioides]